MFFFRRVGVGRGLDAGVVWQSTVSLNVSVSWGEAGGLVFLYVLGFNVFFLSGGGGLFLLLLLLRGKCLCFW